MKTPVRLGLCVAVAAIVAAVSIATAAAQASPRPVTNQATAYNLWLETQILVSEAAAGDGENLVYAKLDTVANAGGGRYFVVATVRFDDGRPAVEVKQNFTYSAKREAEGLSGWTTGPLQGLDGGPVA